MANVLIKMSPKTMDSKDQNPTNGTLSDDELKSLNGSEADPFNDAINLFHQDIASLCKDRSELQGKITALLSEMEQSEVQTKAVAAHTSYLEGELARTQDDLISASSLAEDAENEKKNFENESNELRSEVTVLKDRITDLEVERGRKDGEIRILNGKIRTLEEKKVTLETEIKTMKENEKARESKEGVLEQVVKALMEKNSELEEGLVSSMGKREQELDSTIIELKEKNLELEGMLKEEDDLNQRSREMNVAAANAKCDSGINWGVVAAAAASTGTVAVAATMLCLCQKQSVNRLNIDAVSFNKKLVAANNGLKRAHSGLKIVVFDIINPLLNLGQHPGNSGFFEVRNACCGTGTVETIGKHCMVQIEGYLGLHLQKGMKYGSL